MRSAPVTPSVLEQIFPGGRVKTRALVGFPRPVPEPELLLAVRAWVHPDAEDEVLERNASFQEKKPDLYEAISKGHPALSEFDIHQKMHAQWISYVVGSPEADPYSPRDTYDLLGWFSGKKDTIRKLSPEKEQETSEIFRRRLGTTQAVEGARAFHQRRQRQRQGTQETRTICRYCRKFFDRTLKGQGVDVCKEKECKTLVERDRGKRRRAELKLPPEV
jgi:hypothetical protein